MPPLLLNMMYFYWNEKDYWTKKKNFVNNSLHIIGQQLDRIEEKVEKPTSSIKIEKPLIDLPSQRHNLSLKTTQPKTIEKVE